MLRPPTVFRLVLLALALASPARAVEVQEVVWGFDARVVPQRINVLSVLLANNSALAFDDAVAVRRQNSLGEQIGADCAEHCYVAPFTSRWVQFYPYVGGENEEWTLHLGRRRAKLPAPRLGPPAPVCLTDPTDPLQGRAGLRTFPDNLFPLTVAATDGLAAVVLDHAPRWEPVRRRALLDWLRRGGTLHLLPGEGGGYPQFSGDLSVLNDPAERFRVGTGLVVRHRAARADVTEKFLAEAGCPLPKLESSGMGYLTLDEGVLASLKSLVRPDHNWPLMYVALIVYLLLIGPVNYLIGRRAPRFRRAVLFFLVTAAAFAWALGAMGRRGFGEVASIHSLAYAAPIDEEHYDVTQWVNVFVIDGDYYTLAHGGDHNLYAACESLEPVKGLVEAGAGGRFYVDIPLCSNRPLLHRARLKGHALGLRVAEWRQGEDLEALTLSVGPGFPQEILGAWVLHGDRFYTMSRQGATLRLTGGRGRSCDEFLSESNLGMNQFYYAMRGEEHEDPRDAAEDMAPTLIGRAVGGVEDLRHGLTLPPPSADEAQFFLLTESPPGFALQAEGLGREVGYVLYHVRLFKPEDTNG